MSEQAVFQSYAVSGAVVFEARGEVDISNAPDFRTALEQAGSTDLPTLVVSLSGISYFDSQSLEILVDFSKRLTVNRRRLVLVAPKDSSPRTLLDLSGISTLIGVFESVDEAVRAALEEPIVGSEAT